MNENAAKAAANQISARRIPASRRKRVAASLLAKRFQSAGQIVHGKNRAGSHAANHQIGRSWAKDSTILPADWPTKMSRANRGPPANAAGIAQARPIVAP